MKIGRIIFAVIILAVIVIVGIAATSSVLIIAEDESEGGIPGVDMGATWNLTGGFNWIYPGSSFNAQHQTLHNIHLDDPDNPYGAAKEIMEYTYNISPNIIITVNNNAAEKIFGGDIISDIRQYDWGDGMDRASEKLDDSAQSQGGQPSGRAALRKAPGVCPIRRVKKRLK